jgi:hypothetical protein
MEEINRKWRFKKDVDIIHIRLYHLENWNPWCSFETWNSKSFQFIHLWTSFYDLNWERGYSRNLIQEKDIDDLRGVSSLMATQQAIKVNNSHEWIDMVTKTEKLQILKTTQASNSRRIFKSNYTRAHKSFQLSRVYFSIFDLYII